MEMGRAAPQRIAALCLGSVLLLRHIPPEPCERYPPIPYNVQTTPVCDTPPVWLRGLSAVCLFPRTHHVAVRVDNRAAVGKFLAIAHPLGDLRRGWPD